MLMACGMEYLGLPLRLPVDKEDLGELPAAAIIRSIRPPSRRGLHADHR
jgi:hypothetical protein